MAPEQRYVSKELTHFVGRSLPSDQARFELLVSILKEEGSGYGGEKGLWLTHPPHDPKQPGGNLVLSGNPLESLEKGELVCPEMVCFCDIPSGDLGIHMEKYGQFGIAFTKEFLVERGANPVFYMEQNAFLTDHRYANGKPERHTRRGEFFAKAAEDWKKGANNGDRRNILKNAVNWYFFPYIKLFGSSLDDNHEKNFYMEREWRLLGNVCFQLDDIVRVIMPCEHARAFRNAVPAYSGSLTLV